MAVGPGLLIVESEYLIALDVAQSLEGVCPDVAYIAHDAAWAEKQADQWEGKSLAVIEIEESLPANQALAERLRHAGMPVIGITADNESRAYLSQQPAHPVLLKPIDTALLVNVAQQLLHTR